MRAVVILICHDHYRPVSEVLHVLVLPSHLDTEDLDEILNLRVLHDLLVGGFSHIQEFAAQREHSIVVPPDHFNASQGEGFS